MHDLFHLIGSDLEVSAAGDLRPVSDTDRVKQRILRRLLTSPGEYLFHPEYGAGLGKKVGETVNDSEWKALIRGQMLLEDAVAPTPPPTIKFRLIEGGVSVSVAYTDATAGTSEILRFDVTR